MTTWKMLGSIGLIVAAAVALGGCKSGPQTNSSQPGKGLSINGQGASFPDPIYQAWASKYFDTTGTKISYTPSGSGAGIKAIKDKTSDFGGTDEALTAKDQADNGLIQFPTVIGGVVPIVHIDGIESGKLKLSGDLLAKIYLGDIKKWDDAAIKALNPDLNLPSADIQVVQRSDGSGTSWLFTNYLGKVSEDWKTKVGVNKAPKWPVGVGGKGNPGVADQVKQLPNSIGYVEYAFAVQSKLAYALVSNKAGKFVQPDMKSFQAAAASADWKGAEGFYVILTDQAGDDVWPIVGATFILMQKDQPDAAKAKAILGFFDWAYKHGADQAARKDYVPLPKDVYELVEKAWAGQISSGGKPVWQ